MMILLNLNVKTDAATGNVITPNVADVHRVRIGYTKVSDAGTFEIKLNERNYNCGSSC